MEENKLFETGCALCGAKHWRPGHVGVALSTIKQNTHAAPDLLGLQYCGVCCLDRHGAQYEPMFDEMRRRKSLARVEPVASEQTREVKYYGTQPSVLPKTLPAGTEFIGSGVQYRFRLLEPSAELASDKYLNSDTVIQGCDSTIPIDAWRVCWETVPVQDESVPTCSNEQAPTKQPRRDPYVCARETNAKNLSGSPYELSGQLERSIAFQTDKKNAERLAALSPAERRKAQALLDFDRPVVKGGHPGSWPADAFWDAGSCDP